MSEKKEDRISVSDEDVEAYLQKRLEGPPVMRELDPVESMDINKSTVDDKGRIDYELRLLRKIELSLGKNLADAGIKTNSAYGELVERFLYLEASPDGRRRFLEDKKADEAQRRKLLKGSSS